jgi:hypothetical protein
MKETSSAADCLTCYGKGEIVDDFGPSRCPDCGGAGKQLDGNTQTEWRLRDIEGAHVGTAHGSRSKRYRCTSACRDGAAQRYG